HNPSSIAIVPDSPADKAGVKENDIITELDGEKLGGESDLSDVLQKFQVDDEIEMTILRKDQTIKLKTKIEERK
ncbi:MAG TPA: hypothetical protein DEB13_00810, partial [Candidatus Yanofskybacteria bacterium]|nr:hypothetical protein [Candidatus Yanofskybacteria bacterium]